MVYGKMQYILTWSIYGMIKLSQLREHIIVPTLSALQLYSTDAEEMLVFTCATESDGGSLLVQVKGPALGIYQMEPNTYTDIWMNFIKYRSSLLSLLAMHFDAPRIPPAERMVYDLKFATAMARIHYFRVTSALPKAGDLDAMWDYYKAHYNTAAGKAKKDKAIADYQRFLKS